MIRKLFIETKDGALDPITGIGAISASGFTQIVLTVGRPNETKIPVYVEEGLKLWVDRSEKDEQTRLERVDHDQIFDLMTPSGVLPRGGKLGSRRVTAKNPALVEGIVDPLPPLGKVPDARLLELKHLPEECSPKTEHLFEKCSPQVEQVPTVESAISKAVITIHELRRHRDVIKKVIDSKEKSLPEVKNSKRLRTSWAPKMKKNPVSTSIFSLAAGHDVTSGMRETEN